MRRADNADAIRRIGRNEHQIRIRCLNRSDNRGIVSGRGRVRLVVNDLQARFLHQLMRAFQRVAGEFRIRPDQRHRRGLGVQRHRGREKSRAEALLRMRPASRSEGEIIRVVELAVHREAQQRQERPLMLHHHRHRGGDHVGGVTADDQIDFVHVQQLRVDARHGGGIRLVVVEHQLHRAAQQTAFGIDLFFPDLHRKQRGLAVRREAARQRHAEANGDGFFVRPSRREAGENEHSRAQGAAEPTRYHSEVPPVRMLPASYGCGGVPQAPFFTSARPGASARPAV